MDRIMKKMDNRTIGVVDGFDRSYADLADLLFVMDYRVVGDAYKTEKRTCD